MRIEPMLTAQNNKQNNISFKAVTFTDYNSQYNSIKGKLKQEIENFEKSRGNVAILGEGKFGETYKFTSPELRNIVIKRSKKGYVDTYEQEYNNLIQVPHNKVGGQGGVARAYNYSTGQYYLLSTLTEGREVSPYNRYTENHLKSLFTKMFELDKIGLYHGDLNGKNILLTKSGEINFIDYQWAQKVSQYNFFDSKKSEQLLLPLSRFPENAQMFEMATMPYYLEQIGSKKEKEDFLKMYLKNKAEYHSKRYDYIKNITQNWQYSSERALIRDCLETEKAKSKIYRNPSDEVLKVELKKFQFLSDYRDAYGHVDPNMFDRNILTSTSSYLCSISSVQDYRKEIAKQLEKCKDADLRSYLRGEAEYGRYWYENLRTFSTETFDYIMRAATKHLNYDEDKHKFHIGERNPRKMSGNRDILSVMDSRFQTTFDKSFDIPYGLDRRMHNIFSEPMQDIKRISGSDHKAFNRRKHIQDAYRHLKEFKREGKTLDLLNTSELITLNAREFYDYSYHNMHSSRLDSLLYNMLEEATTMTENLYHTILNGLSESNPRSILVQGYENMRKFVPKL